MSEIFSMMLKNYDRHYGREEKLLPIDHQMVSVKWEFTEILGGKAPYFSTEMKACLQYPISIVEYGIL